MKAQLDKSKKTILFYQPNRYTKFNAKEAEAHFEQHVPCNFVIALTWEDFVSKLDLNPDLVGFHCDMFDHHDVRISALIATVQTTLKIKNKTAKICVTVNNDTTQDTINKLKKSNITGIQLGRGHNGIHLAIESWRELLNRNSYWPEQVISESEITCINKKPLHLYFGESLVDTPKALDNANDVIDEIPCIVKWCTTLDDLSSSITENPRNIAVHIDIVRRHGGTISEFMMMLETIIKYANISDKPNIAIVIESDTHLLTIKELQKHKILGIIPSAKSFNKQECVTAIKLITNGQRYWPKDIISKLPGNEEKVKNKNSNSLTLRQQEVFDLIAKRGLSNKQIARVLNISESTVKIHVSAVMKNLCVRNRTQLALTK